MSTSSFEKLASRPSLILASEDTAGGQIPTWALTQELRRQPEFGQVTLFTMKDLASLVEAHVGHEVHDDDGFVIAPISYTKVTEGQDIFGTGRDELKLFIEAYKLFGKVTPTTFPLFVEMLERSTPDTWFVLNPTALLHFGPLLVAWAAQYGKLPNIVLAAPYMQLNVPPYETSQFGQEGRIKLAMGLFARRGNKFAHKTFPQTARSFSYNQLLEYVRHTFYLISPELIKPEQLAESIQPESTHSFIGYPQLEHSEPLSPRIHNFIHQAHQDHYRVAVLTLGSMNIDQIYKHQIVKNIAQAAAAAGNVRLIVLGKGFSQEDLPVETLFVENFVNYPQLFAETDIVLSHGGAGTTHEILSAQLANLRQGRPAPQYIPLPFLADQYNWAHRMQEIGAATDWVDNKDLYREKATRNPFKLARRAFGYVRHGSPQRRIQAAQAKLTAAFRDENPVALELHPLPPEFDWLEEQTTQERFAQAMLGLAR